MNRYFDPSTQKSDVPRRVYAKLDHVEPLRGADGVETMFAFEAVDANWRQFERGGMFDLSGPPGLISRRWRYVQDNGDPPFQPINLEALAHAPLYRLEITANGQAAKSLTDLEGGWM